MRDTTAVYNYFLYVGYHKMSVGHALQSVPISKSQLLYYHILNHLTYIKRKKKININVYKEEIKKNCILVLLYLFDGLFFLCLCLYRWIYLFLFIVQVMFILV